MATFLHTLLRLSLLGSLLTGLLLLVQPLIKSKTAAYYLWLLVLVRLCLPVGVTLPLPALPDQTAAADTSDRPAGQAFSVRLPILSHTRAWCAQCRIAPGAGGIHAAYRA